MKTHHELFDRVKSSYSSGGVTDYARLSGSYEALIILMAVQLEVCFPEAYQDIAKNVMTPLMNNH